MINLSWSESFTSLGEQSILVLRISECFWQHLTVGFKCLLLQFSSQVPILLAKGVPLILRRHHTFQQPRAPSARHLTGAQTPHGRKLCYKISYHPSPSHCTLGPLPAPRAFALHLKNAGTHVSGCSKELPEEAVFFRAQPESLLSIVLQAANVVLLLLGPDLLLLCAVDAFIHLELVQGSLTELCTAWPRYAQCNTPPMHWERCFSFLHCNWEAWGIRLAAQLTFADAVLWILQGIGGLQGGWKGCLRAPHHCTRP